jgi:hypothetical protein
VNIKAKTDIAGYISETDGIRDVLHPETGLEIKCHDGGPSV